MRLGRLASSLRRRITAPGRDRFFAGAAEVTPLLGVEIDGITFLVSTADRGVGRSLFVDRTRSELAVLRRALEILGGASGTIVDVGANIGTTAISAIAVHGFSRALAVEPGPANFGLLRANVALNGLEEKVLTERIALSDRPGEAHLALHPSSSGKHRLRSDRQPHSIPVETTTLDALLGRLRIDPDDVGLLWIDVQGHEREVLAGAQSLCEAAVPIVVEVTRSSPALSDLLEPSFDSIVDLRSESRLPISALDELPASLARARDGGGSAITDVLVLPR